MELSKSHTAVDGLLILIAGLLFLMLGLGMVESSTAYLIGGAAIALLGLARLADAAGLCPMCKK
jgi:hypothetical protein